MASFSYTALNHRGGSTQGILQADTEHQVSEQLLQQGLTPLAITRVSSTPTRPSKRASWRRWSTPRLSPSEQCQITQQLATLLEAALPLDDALAAVISQSGKRSTQTVMNLVRARINEGLSLAQALAEQPRSFSSDYIASISAGEQSGQLANVLLRLASYTQQLQATHKRIQLALIYPAMILLVAVALVTLLLTYVVPQVIDVILNMNQSLPLLTRWLIDISGFIQQQGIHLLLALLVLLGTLRLGLQHPGIRLQLHRWLLKLPLIGGFLQLFYAARFSKTLALLTASGVPILEAMGGAREVVGNLWLQQHLNAAREQIRQGASVFHALQQRPILPPIALHLVASGESSSNLDGMLDKSADQLEQQLQHKLGLTLALLEPLIMILMGGLVLAIVMAILMPIFEMNQLIA